MHFFTYSLVLVLMTSLAATINLIIGMLTKGIMSGILIATICMIHLILLTTIFVNFGKFLGREGEGGREGGRVFHSYASYVRTSLTQSSASFPSSLLTQTR